jgi:DNA-binding NarL/FixJ family response regulator
MALRAGGIAVEANVAPHPAVVLSRDARCVRIAVVSGVRFLREVLAEILERDPLVSVVGLCSDLIEAVAMRPTLQADVVLVDATIPEGPNTVKRALDIAPGMRIVACAVRETEDDIVAWAKAGVIGYIPNTAALGDLVRLVIDIHGGEQVCSGRVAAGLLRRIALTANRGDGRSATFPAPALTERERLVAELIRTGHRNKEIARRLSIGLATTKSHVHSLLGKLNVQHRKQVADYLREYDQPPPSN